LPGTLPQRRRRCGICTNVCRACRICGCSKRCYAIPPARNADGEILCHPDVLTWADGREVSLRPLFLAQGFDVVVLEGEIPDEDIGSGIYSAAQELHDWYPAPPGEDWRLTWLGETEDDLPAWFVRPLAAEAIITWEAAHG